MQPLAALNSLDLDGPHADSQMLVDPFPVELVGHARQLELTVQGL